MRMATTLGHALSGQQHTEFYPSTMEIDVALSEKARSDNTSRLNVTSAANDTEFSSSLSEAEEVVEDSRPAGTMKSEAQSHSTEVDAKKSGDEEEDKSEDEVEIINQPSVADKLQADLRKASEEEIDGEVELPEAHVESSASAGEDSDEDLSDSDAVQAWEEASENAEGPADVTDRNNCVFCGQDEEHDPAEDFEEYLACVVCGDNSHRQCARDNDFLDSHQSAHTWRCPECILNGLQADPAQTASGEDSAIAKQRDSAPKLARDLLPASRGVSRPDSHSVFNQLIVNDDPMDGSRHLRKRKASLEEAELQPLAKRRAIESRNRASQNENGIGMADGTPRTRSLNNGAIVDDNSGARANGIAPQSSRPSRTRRPPKRDGQYVTVVKRDPSSLVVKFHIQGRKLLEVVGTGHEKKKIRGRPSTADRRVPFLLPTPYSATNYATPFYSFDGRESDELKLKPYGGILKEEEAETIKTLPQASDRAKFEDARKKAEEEWRKKAMAAESEAPSSHKISGPASRIQCISFGGYEIDTWYAAPYPEEYSRNRVLYICEFCLKYMNSDYVAWRHKLKCPAKHPPGDEIYRSASVSVFEVDGRKNPVYCQNLCLLAKLFLGSKTLYYDVEPFLFYVMTEYDDLGCHFVGYFSKEKRPSSQNNVSCILTLPIHQRKGYGNLLIDFSYLLTRVEQKTGSPEKPLSDMGLVSYRNYWRLVLCYQLAAIEDHSSLSIADLGSRTGMTADDIVSALEGLRALVRDPVTGTYALRLDRTFFKEYIVKWEAKGYVRLDPAGLIWTPYIMGRSNLAIWNQAPALSTVAPREETDVEDETEAVPAPAVNGTLDTQDDVSPTTSTAAPQLNGLPPSKLNNLKQEQHQLNGILSTDAPQTQSDILSTPSGPLQTLSSPSRQLAEYASPSVTKPSTPAPPSTQTPSIPSTRFELYPPLIGVVGPRRKGRPPSAGLRKKAGLIGGGRRRDRERERQRARDRKAEAERLKLLEEMEVAERKLLGVVESANGVVGPIALQQQQHQPQQIVKKVNAEEEESEDDDDDEEEESEEEDEDDDDDDDEEEEDDGQVATTSAATSATSAAHKRAVNDQASVEAESDDSDEEESSEEEPEEESASEVELNDTTSRTALEDEDDESEAEDVEDEASSVSEADVGEEEDEDEESDS